MRWSVSHETIYRYSVPVVFAPHVLRLTPLAGRSVIITRTLEAEPTPVAINDFADAFYNTCTRVAFGSFASSVLRFHSRFEVDILAPPSLAQLPLAALPWPTYPSDPLAAYNRSEPLPLEVEAFIRDVASAAGGNPVAYLDRLGQALYARIEKTVRLDGAAQLPEETLALSRGACRDIAVLFIAGCRKMGIPARFVSGYQGGAEAAFGRRHLHAWPEAFLPGAGWRGWDPTYGIRVEESHIPLCAAPGQVGTMPVEGGFYFSGPNVTSTLDYAIRVER